MAKSVTEHELETFNLPRLLVVLKYGVDVYSPATISFAAEVTGRYAAAALRAASCDLATSADVRTQLLRLLVNMQPLVREGAILGIFHLLSLDEADWHSPLASIHESRLREAVFATSVNDTSPAVRIVARRALGLADIESLASITIH